MEITLNGMDTEKGGEMIRKVNVREDEQGSLIDDETVSDEEKLDFFESIEKTPVKNLSSDPENKERK